MTDYIKVENPIEGKEYIAINQLDKFPCKQGVYCKDEHCSGNFILRGENNTIFYYDKYVHYLALPSPPEPNHPNEIIKDFSKALKEFKPVLAKTKTYLMNETAKLGDEIARLPREIGSSHNGCGITSWYITQGYSLGKYVANLHMGDTILKSPPPEILNKWHELCELSILLKEVE